MKATVRKYLSRELPFGARQYREAYHSTFGAAGDEPEGGDLYIAVRDIMISMINWVVPRIISPHMRMHMGLFFIDHGTVLLSHSSITGTVLRSHSSITGTLFLSHSSIKGMVPMSSICHPERQRRILLHKSQRFSASLKRMLI